MESLSMQKEPPKLPFSTHKMQVKRKLPLYMGVRGWMEGECLCVCGIDDRYILYKWFFSRVLKFANVHCRPGSREFIFAVKYIQLSPKLTTCSN